MFPMTEEERIALLRSNLSSDVEKREAKRDAAAAALGDAQEAYDGSRVLLAVFDHMVRERNDQRAAVTVDSAASSGVDQVTGEVTSKGEPDDVTDNIGAEATPEPAVSVVVVLYPGSDEPQVVKIGQYTRYSQLVAGYLSEAGLDHAIADYAVVGEDGSEDRNLEAIISGDDYGKRLMVQALPDTVAANEAESAA
jgi:hypothetical protein